MNKVLAAVNTSAVSQPVLAMARAVADALDASVEVLHITEDVGPAWTADHVAGAPVRILTGDPAELLASAAVEDDVVAIVIGARGHPGGPHPAGHMAMVLAGRTNKPVVVVPPGARPPERLRTAVVAMEGTPGKARALQRSIELSTRAGLEIVVVHVEEEESVPSFSDQIQHENEVYTQEFLARHLIGAPKMRVELRVGDPVEEVLAAVASAAAELVAVGWRPTNDPGRGAVARKIVERSPVPVLLVAIA